MAVALQRMPGVAVDEFGKSVPDRPKPELLGMDVVERNPLVGCCVVECFHMLSLIHI